MIGVVGYEELYSVTADGRIRAHPNRIHDGIWMKPSCRKGYLFVNLCKGGEIINKNVHRIVAEAFLPNPNDLPQVNHINGIKTDNRVVNLEWCTASQNKKHSWEIGTSITTEAKRRASRSNAYKMHEANRKRRNSCQPR